MTALAMHLTAVHPTETVIARCPEVGIALDHFLPDFTDSTWPDRVRDVEGWLARLADLRQDGSADELRDSAIRARTVITAMLEAVPGIQLGCLDSAMLVTMSVRTEWRLTAARWLEAAGVPAIDDWLAGHPGCEAILTATTRVLN